MRRGRLIGRRRRRWQHLSGWRQRLIRHAGRLIHKLERLSGRSRSRARGVAELNVGGRLWKRITELNTTGRLWRRVTELNVNGRFWRCVAELNTGRWFWRRVAELNTGGPIWRNQKRPRGIGARGHFRGEPIDTPQEPGRGRE